MSAGAVKGLPGIADLAQHLCYEPELGKLTWIKRTCSRAVLGGRAGTVHREGYVMVKFRRSRIGAHRIAWALHYGEWPNGPIDHINRDPSDNRIANLRIVSPSENSLNRGAQSNNRLGVKGVIADKRGGYRASITINGHRHDLGRHDTIEQASASYRAAFESAQEARRHV